MANFGFDSFMGGSQEKSTEVVSMTEMIDSFGLPENVKLDFSQNEFDPKKFEFVALEVDADGNVRISDTGKPVVLEKLANVDFNAMRMIMAKGMDNANIVCRKTTEYATGRSYFYMATEPARKFAGLNIGRQVIAESERQKKARIEAEMKARLKAELEAEAAAATQSPDPETDPEEEEEVEDEDDVTARLQAEAEAAAKAAEKAAKAATRAAAKAAAGK